MYNTYRQKRDAASIIGYIALIAVLLFISVLFGFLSATSNIFIALILVAFLLGGVLVFSPDKLMLFLTASCLIIIGTLESFFYISQANWMASLLAGALGFSVLTSKKITKNNTELSTKDYQGLNLTVFGLIIFLVTLAGSALINRNGVGQLIVGIRGYLPFIGIFLALYFGRVKPKVAWYVVYIIIAVGCVQGIYCLIEKFWIAPRIFNGYGDYELMLGSFGGSFYTGGYTGEMAAFVCMNLILCYVLMQKKILPTYVVVAAALSALISVGFAETKIVFLLLPLMIFVVFWKYPERINAQLIKGLIFLLIGAAIIVTIYAIRFWEGSEHIGRAFFYTFDPNFEISPGHRGRIASIIYWFDSVLSSGDIIHSLIGYGPASSISGTVGAGSSVAGVGSAAQRFGAGLDISAITKLLWDGGLLGTLGFMLIIGGSFLQAHKLALNPNSPVKTRWLMIALKAWLFAFAFMLPYQPLMLGGAPMQFLFWATIGLVAYFSRWQITQDEKNKDKAA